MRTSFLLAVLTALALSCGDGNVGRDASSTIAHEQAPEMAKGRAEREGMPDAGASATYDRKIIRTGELRFEVGDPEKARANVLERVKDAGGYVEGDDRNDQGNALITTLRVRIPAGIFDVFVASLADLGTLQYQSINASDVTAEWVDVEARLKAKREVEARFLEIVKQAKNVTEVLEVERELGNVRAEIEGMEARMKNLRDQVGMSTLTIACVKPRAGSVSTGPQAGVALREGWNNLLRVLVGALYIWPFVLLAGCLLWWLLRRDRTQRKPRA